MFESFHDKIWGKHNEKIALHLVDGQKLEIWINMWGPGSSCTVGRRVAGGSHSGGQLAPPFLQGN